MKDLYLITGISNGLGKALFDNLKNKNNVIGTTTKKKLNDLNKNIIYFEFNFNLKIEKINFLIDFIETFSFGRLIFIHNAAIYDINNTKKEILDVNFYNQILLYEKLKSKYSSKIFINVFLSSFEIFNKNSKIPNYKYSKELYVKYYLKNKKKIKNNNYYYFKLFILGGIRTETYLKNKKLSFIRKLITASTYRAASFIIRNINSQKNEIIYFPKVYKILFKFKLNKP